jgi:hypothetical protein
MDGIDESQPRDSVRLGSPHVERDRCTDAMTDHAGPFDAQDIEEPNHPACMARHGDVGGQAIWGCGVAAAIPQQVGNDHTVPGW